MRPSEIREINSRLNRVEQQISKIPSRIGSGGGGGGGEVVPSDADPLAIVASDPDAGVGLEYARTDHTHLGMPFIAVDAVGDLPTDQPAGVLAVVGEGPADYTLYMRDGSVWIPLTTTVVLALPAIPTVGKREVFWTSEGAGTGDDQIWMAYAGMTIWYPMMKTTSLSGAPGA